MPKVGKTHFPYTKEGEEAAKALGKSTGQKVQHASYKEGGGVGMTTKDSDGLYGCEWIRNNGDLTLMGSTMLPPSNQNVPNMMGMNPQMFSALHAVSAEPASC